VTAGTYQWERHYILLMKKLFSHWEVEGELFCNMKRDDVRKMKVQFCLRIITTEKSIFINLIFSPHMSLQSRDTLSVIVKAQKN
jgi:hypothetical protein